MKTHTTTPLRRSRFLALATALPLALLPLSLHAQTSIAETRYEISFDESSKGLQHGSLFSGDEYADLGGGVKFTVDSKGAHDQLMIFDTDETGTADSDLENPFAGGNLQGRRNLGNALIIAENILDSNKDGIGDSPDDEANGGTIGVIFGNTRIQSVGFSLYDTPENKDSDVSIVFKDGKGNSVTWVAGDLIAHGTNVSFANHHGNEFKNISAKQLGLSNIQAIDFNIESGAVDSLHFCATVPEPSALALLGLGAVSTLFRRKRG